MTSFRSSICGNGSSQLVVEGAGLHLITPIETVIASANTPVKVLGTTSSNVLYNFDDGGTSNRLRYIGEGVNVFQVVCSVSVTAASNNEVIAFYIAKNGVVETSSEVQRLIGTGSDIGAMSISMVVELDTNDFVELWCENKQDATNITAESINMSIH